MYGCVFHITGSVQQPTADSGTKCATQLDTQGGAGVHHTFQSVTGGQSGVLGAAGDQCVHIALQGCDTDGRDSGECQHQRQASHIGCCHNANSAQSSDHIAPDVELIHAAKLLDDHGQNREGNDHGDIDSQRQGAENRFIAEDILGVVGADADDRCVELSQNVAAADDDVVLVLEQNLKGLQESEIVFLLSVFFYTLVIFRQLLDGEYGIGVGDQTNNRVDDGDCSPASHTTAEPADCINGHSFNDNLGCKGKDEAQRTDLDTLAGVLGDQCSQRCVGNVVSGEEDCVQQSVGEEEEDVLCGLAPAGGNGEAGDQSNGAADIRPEHPGTGLAHLGVGLIDQSAEEEVADTVKNLGKCDQGTDDAHAHADGVGQIDHHECGQQCVYAVASNVAGTVADFVIPFQICLFVHVNTPFLCGMEGGSD